MLANILLDSFNYFVAILLFLSVSVIFYVVYDQIVKPYFEMKSKEIPLPPEVGKEYYLITDESVRTTTFSIGRNVGDIPTKCSAISEDHLTFTFKKHPVNEEYEIVIKRNGPTLFKPPRMQTYSVMESTEKLESYEIIGKTAEFRISNQLIKERMINYIEIGFSSKFIFDKNGKERLQFIFKIEKIHPGLNLHKRDGNGNFPFGKEEASENKSESQEAI
ncbi:MAG: hypothetical protein N3A69_16445 [Leptospiraceae bacterium]|nr:hypothetical protein [Leptospiraceae bacterium]